MARRIQRDPIYSGRRFSAETIETCVRWYITYRLSYRDLVAMMAEQGIVVSHTTIMRWVLRYVPEYERRWSRFARSPGSSWRMDETAVSVRGGRHYLYRAVDRRGKSVASLLCNDRTMEAAQAFFRMAVSQEGVPWPEKINVDGNSAIAPRVALAGGRRSPLARCGGQGAPLSQQRGRAGPSRHQATLRAHAGTEEFPLGRDHARRH